jgi:hypothetical protein
VPPFSQGFCIIKRLKKKRKRTKGESRRGITGIRAILAIIPYPQIDPCKKHLLATIPLLCITATACGAESVQDINFFGISQYNG